MCCGLSPSLKSGAENGEEGESSMKKLIGIVVSWLIAIFIAWIIWGVATPYLCALVPAGTYKGIVDIIIYLCVAGLGGVGLPITIALSGTILFLK